MLVDIFIIVVVAASTAVGVVTGFVWQATGLAALIAGTFSAWVFSGVLGGPLGRWLSLGEGGGEALAFFLVFGFVSIGLRVVASVMKTRIDKYHLEHHNRLWGGIAGAAKGFLISMVIVSVLAVMGQGGTMVAESHLGRNLASVGTLFFPENARTTFSKMLQQVEKKIIPAPSQPTEEGGAEVSEPTVQKKDTGNQPATAAQE